MRTPKRSRRKTTGRPIEGGTAGGTRKKPILIELEYDPNSKMPRPSQIMMEALERYGVKFVGKKGAVLKADPKVRYVVDVKEAPPASVVKVARQFNVFFRLRK